MWEEGSPCRNWQGFFCLCIKLFLAKEKYIHSCNSYRPNKNLKTIYQKYEHLIYGIIQSFITCGVASVVSTFNSDSLENFFIIWISSWIASWLVMIPIVLLVSPVIKKLTKRITSNTQIFCVLLSVQDHKIRQFYIINRCIDTNCFRINRGIRRLVLAAYIKRTLKPEWLDSKLIICRIRNLKHSHAYFANF